MLNLLPFFGQFRKKNPVVLQILANFLVVAMVFSYFLPTPKTNFSLQQKYAPFLRLSKLIIKNTYPQILIKIGVFGIPRAAKADARADAEGANLKVYCNFDQNIISPWLFMITEPCKDYTHVEFAH